MSQFFAKIHLVGLLSLLLGGCTASENLTTLDQVKAQQSVTNEVTVNFCTDPAYTPKQYLKMMIILDHSGSNQLNYKMNADGTPAVVNNQLEISTNYATDPLGRTRYGNVNTPGTLLNFLQNIEPNDPKDPTRFFALIDFNSAVRTYPANAAFTADTVDFYNFVQRDALNGGTSPADSGYTNYVDSLSAAYGLINSDIQAAKACAALTKGSSSPGAWCIEPGVAVSSSYVIVFMSDGSPITDMKGVTQVNGQYVVGPDFSYYMQPSSQIMDQVATISSLATAESASKYVSSVNLFTVYYYAQNNIDGNAQALLKNMAKAGNGISYNALSGSNINYANFQPPVKRIKFTLADIFVTNASASYWNDGILRKDSDLDGIPDQVENTMGSDPSKSSSDNNGVSDLVKYRANAAAGVNYAGTTCSGIGMSQGAFVSSDPNGLNDCEKLVLNDAAGIGYPDSNGDMIPDWLQFLAGVPFQSGSNPNINQPDHDGYTVYQKIKYSLPFNIPTDQQVDLKPANYKLDLLSSNSSQDCYKLSVTDLPTVGDQNTVRVDIIEKSQLLNQSYLYKVAKKNFPAGSLKVHFDDWTNKAEIAAKTWNVWQ